jgi:hypothetical protein
MRPTRPNELVREGFVAEAIERYVNWRLSCVTVRHAYERWSRAQANERLITFAAYRAALDQEESAATLYRRMVGIARPSAAVSLTADVGSFGSSSRADGYGATGPACG